MTKVVYNNCYGGFGLSSRAVMRYAEIKGFKLYPYVSVFKAGKKTTYNPATEKELDDRDQYHIHFFRSPDPDDQTKGNYFSSYNIPRNDPALVQVVEEMGDKANGICAQLAIEELIQGTMYRISEYDGNESVEIKGSGDWTVA